MREAARCLLDIKLADFITGGPARPGGGYTDRDSFVEQIDGGGDVNMDHLIGPLNLVVGHICISSLNACSNHP